MPEPKIASSAACGCRVEIEEDELHVRPCSAAHEPALTKAARDMAEQLAVPLEERYE